MSQINPASDQNRPLSQLVHFLLLSEIAKTGRAPKLARLGELAEKSEIEVAEALHELERNHGVILKPGTCEPWSAHPFSLLPTIHWVTNAEGDGWWANCAWCALAIGATLNQDIAINTRSGAEGEDFRFAVLDGVATNKNVVVHFPRTPARWWDNPYCPCADILFFHSAEEVEPWCDRHGFNVGDVLPVNKVVELARRWFGDYLSEEWQRKSPGEARAIVSDLGLDPEFWQMPDEFR